MAENGNRKSGQLTDEQLLERLDRLWASPASIEGTRDNLVVGRFALLEVIGRGAFGVVYRAYDPEVKRYVALKIARPEVLFDDEVRRRFENEAELAASLIHPSIVPVYEARLDNPTPHIVSRLITGPNLATWLRQSSVPTSFKDAALFVAKVAEAVHFAHENGVLHRDLKPSNILLEFDQADSGKPVFDCPISNAQPVITDFGFAKTIDRQVRDTRSSILMGTPLYMAPEQLFRDDRIASRASDVFAMGTVLFELLAGETPFESATYVELLDRLRSDRQPKLRQRKPDVDPAVALICDKARSRRPDDRYTTAAEFADELTRFAAGEPIRTKSESVSTRISRWCRNDRRVINAGWFAMVFNTFAIGWIAVANTLWTTIDPVPSYLDQARLDSLLSVMFVLAPMALVGWLVWRRSRRAIWVGLGLSVMNLVVATMGIGSMPTLYRDMYNGQPAVQKTFYSIFFLAFVVQISLFSCAAGVLAAKRDRGTSAG